MKRMLFAAAATLVAMPAFAENVGYELDGEALNGYFAAAESPKGLVLIIHDWDGMTDYERKRADMLAEMGYDAFALDMFGSTPAGTVDERRAATGALYGDRERMRALISAGVAKAREMSPDGAMVAAGYCFGGAVTLEMARSEMAGQAAGYATFHGGLATPDGQSWSSAVPPLLIMHGGADTAIPMTDVATLTQELEAAEATYTVEVYSKAPHAFTVFGSGSYQERADMESWEAFTEFLSEHLDG